MKQNFANDISLIQKPKEVRFNEKKNELNVIWFRDLRNIEQKRYPIENSDVGNDIGNVFVSDIVNVVVSDVTTLDFGTISDIVYDIFFYIK